MKFIPQEIPEVVLVEPRVFADSRGYFMESYNQKLFDGAVAGGQTFVQDNESLSSRGVLRGLHYQIEHAQGKLVRVTQGAVFDVAVDVRRSSPNFGKWVGVELSAENKRQLWVPPGFAHGFLVLSDQATFNYKVTDFRFPEHERCIRFDDKALGIQWPELPGADWILSDKDMAGDRLEGAEVYE